MGIRNAVAGLFGRKGALVFGTPDTAIPEYIDMSHIRELLGGVSVEQMYRTQPHLRTVISFRARNVAQLGVHAFERVSDTDRKRLTDDPLSKLLAQPNPGLTTYELIYGVMSDRDLYGMALLWVVQDASLPSGWAIWPIPPAWVLGWGGGTAWEPGWVDVARPGGSRERIPTADLIVFRHWDPAHPARGLSPVEALKDVLAEQVHANQFRQQMWQRGGRVGSYISRPSDAPAWSPEAKTKFARDFAAAYSGDDGAKAGGTPLLEDGMTMARLGFSAKEDEWIEGVKLSLGTVAQVYHVNPTMVGVLDDANYSNVEAFRKMLYGDSLGPDIADLEARLNAFLVPKVAKASDVYVEFNIQEKLQGNFQEQATIMSTAIGRPWMTADEGRGKFNMPALGGDAAELVTPLNVIVGGQASPRDSGTQNEEPKASRVRSKAASARVKATPRDEDADAAEDVLAKFFRRQRAAVLSSLGAKSDDWWDEGRWNKELAGDLYELAVSVSSDIGRATLKDIGVSPDRYNVDRTRKFLEAVAESRAGAINSTTRDQIKAALAGDVDPEAESASPAGVFDVAEASRAKAAAITLATTFVAFAVTEAAKQAGGEGATKTWAVNSGNPRPDHAAMDGETVGVDDLFSNGAAWPGDPVLGAEGVANCSCSVEVNIP